jgi:hypothetical protein
MSRRFPLHRGWAGAALIASGCAYTFNPSAVPSHIKTLEIPVLANRTLEPALAEELTRDLTDRFLRDNTMRVVQKDGDAVLEGEITGYQDRVFGFNAEEKADEYIVLLTVKLRLRDRIKNKELWSEEHVQGRASYFLGASENAVNSEEKARVLAMKQVVDFALARSVEGW